MLKTVHKVREYYYKGELIRSYYNDFIINESEFTQETTTTITWENVDIHCAKTLQRPFYIRSCKKGKKIGFDYCDIGWGIKPIKQWKTSSVNIVIKEKYVEWKATINDILDYRDNEKAIQYLLERGMHIIGQ